MSELSIPVELRNLPVAPPPLLSKEEHVWLSAWCSVAQAENCYGKTIPAAWAHEALTAFRKEFSIVR